MLVNKIIDIYIKNKLLKLKVNLKENNMEIITRGLFKLSASKNYVLIDSNKNEQGTLEVNDETVTAILNDSDEVEFTDADELQNWLSEKNYIITTDSVRWIVYNPNPDTDKANDCSIRAYCAAENLKWEDAYDVATQYGKIVHYMPNDSTTCKKIIEEEYGYTFHKLKKEERGMTVKEFAINHPEGTYICDCRRHLVTCINGEYYDSWDSGDKKIGGYYSK